MMDGFHYILGIRAPIVTAKIVCQGMDYQDNACSTLQWKNLLFMEHFYLYYNAAENPF